MSRLPRILPVEEVNRLVVENQGLALKYARAKAQRWEFVNRRAGPSHVDDLVAEALVGLHKAAMHYDPSRGVRFSTYAYRWIETYVLDYIQTFQCVVRTPRSSTYTTRRAAVMRLVRELERTHGEASSEEIARRLKIDEEEVRALRAEAVGRYDNSLEQQELVQEAPTAQELLERVERIKLLRKALKKLPPLHAKILRERYLKHDEDGPAKLRDVGAKVGCSREWVRLKELEALKHLREALEEELEIAV